MGACRDATAASADCSTPAAPTRGRKKKAYTKIAGGSASQDTGDGLVNFAVAPFYVPTAAADVSSSLSFEPKKQSKKHPSCEQYPQGVFDSVGAEAHTCSSSRGCPTEGARKKTSKRHRHEVTGTNDDDFSADMNVAAAATEDANTLAVGEGGGGFPKRETKCQKKGKDAAEGVVWTSSASPVSCSRTRSISGLSSTNSSNPSQSPVVSHNAEGGLHSAFSNTEAGSSGNCCRTSSSVFAGRTDTSGVATAPAVANNKKQKRKEFKNVELKKKIHRSQKNAEEDAEKTCAGGRDVATSTAASNPQRATTPAVMTEEENHLEAAQLQAYKLTTPTLQSLQQRGIQQLLPIQAATFSSVYSGKDIIVRADTGTGKTLAFALPLVERLLSHSAGSTNDLRKSSASPTTNSSDNKHVWGSSDRGGKIGVRLIVLLPTRELAQQVHMEFVSLLQGRLRTACLYGGSNGTQTPAGPQQWQSNRQANTYQQKKNGAGRGGRYLGQLQQQQQLDDLRTGRCSILVGCPGRVKDVINRGLVKHCRFLESVVLDEADRLLDMGFREDVEEILQWCRDAWYEGHTTCMAASAGKRGRPEEEEEDNDEEEQKKKCIREKEDTVVESAEDTKKTKKSEAVGVSQVLGKHTHSLLSRDHSSESPPALQYLLFTATLPHWAKSIASRFMRQNRLLIDAKRLSGPIVSESGSCTSSSTSSKEKTMDAHATSHQGAGVNTSNRITYLVLFCPWKNRVRVLENILTIYSGCATFDATNSAPAASGSTPGAPGSRLTGLGSSLGTSGLEPVAPLSADVSASSLPCSASAVDGAFPPSVAVRKSGWLSPVAAERGSAAAAVIFAETKQQVNEIALESGLRQLAAPLHGDLPQQQRETTLHAFKSGCFPYLVATDVAARGLHVDSLPLVVQLSPPRDLDSFIHRAGRTGRAGKSGICLTFAADFDVPTLHALEKKLRIQFKRVGVPQPAGIQRHLLNMQLQRILPAAADSVRTAFDDRTHYVANGEASVGDTDKANEERGKKQEKLSEAVVAAKDTKLISAKRERYAAVTGDPAGDEIKNQILEAADRVLQALSPREAVRRCLTLLVRHAAADPHNGIPTAHSSSSPMFAVPTTGTKGEHATMAAGERLSCLNGREGFQTYVLRKRDCGDLREGNESLLRSPGQVWRLLKGALLHRTRSRPIRYFSNENSSALNPVEEVLERIHCLTLTADGKGAVFDVAIADVPAFAAHVLRRCGERRPLKIERSDHKAGSARKIAEVQGDEGSSERREAGTHEIPFVIEEAEELPELVDTLALRRSEGQQGGSNRSSQQDAGRCQSYWRGGSESNSRGRGGYQNSNSDGRNKTMGSSRSSFPSTKSYSGKAGSQYQYPSRSERRGMQQRSSWTSGSSTRGRSIQSGRGRGGLSCRRGGQQSV